MTVGSTEKGKMAKLASLGSELRGLSGDMSSG